MNSKIKDMIYQYISESNLIQLTTVNTQRRHYNKIVVDATHREVAKDEIVIEFDVDNKQLVVALIKKLKRRLAYYHIQFSIFNHHGRSPHIHIYKINGLSEIDPVLRSLYKKKFIETMTYSKFVDIGLNTTREHLIAYEFREHYKTKQTKELVYTNVIDSLDNYILLDILQECKIEYDSIVSDNLKYEKGRDEDFDNRWFIRWLISESLPDGNRDSIMWKNLAILLINYKINPEPIVDLVIERNERKVYSQMEGWLSWSNASKRSFSVAEVMKYCDEHGVDFYNKLKKWRLKG